MSREPTGGKSPSPWSPSALVSILIGWRVLSPSFIKHFKPLHGNKSGSGKGSRIRPSLTTEPETQSPDGAHPDLHCLFKCYMLCICPYTLMHMMAFVCSVLESPHLKKKKKFLGLKHSASLQALIHWDYADHQPLDSPWDHMSGKMHAEVSQREYAAVFIALWLSLVPISHTESINTEGKFNSPAQPQQPKQTTGRSWIIQVLSAGPAFLLQTYPRAMEQQKAGLLKLHFWGCYILDHYRLVYLSKNTGHLKITSYRNDSYVMDVLASAVMVIIFQDVSGSNRHAVCTP